MHTADHELRRRLIELVLRQLAPGALPDPFPDHSKLSDLGLTSLKMVNLMLAIEVEFDITILQADITPEHFYSLATVAALVARTVKSSASA